EPFAARGAPRVPARCAFASAGLGRRDAGRCQGERIVSRPEIHAHLDRPEGQWPLFSDRWERDVDACVAFVRALCHASPDALPRVLLGSFASTTRAADLRTTFGTRR